MVNKLHKEWLVRRTGRVFGFPAITHRVTGERTLMGKYGEIYEFSDEIMGIIIRSPRVAPRVLKLLKLDTLKAIKKGEEAFLKAPKELLSPMIKLLGISKRRPSQAKIANGEQ